MDDFYVPTADEFDSYYAGDNSYNWSPGDSSSYYGQDFVPQEFEFNDYYNFVPPSFDLGAYAPSGNYFSDIAPGADITAIMPGGDLVTGVGDDYLRSLGALQSDVAAYGISDPLLKTAVAESLYQPQSQVSSDVQMALDNGATRNEDGTVTLPSGITLDTDGNVLSVPNYSADGQALLDAARSSRTPAAMTYDPDMLRNGLYGALPVGSFPDDPRTRPSMSYLDRNGDVVGLTYQTDVPAEFQNPYEYRMSNNGEAYIQNIHNGEIVGWLGENGPRYYQDERIANNIAAGRPTLYGTSGADRGGFGGRGSTSGGSSGGSSGGGERKVTTADKVSATRSALATAAAIAAALAKKGGKAPGSSQGDIGANQWQVARMNNRGVANYAGGGLARIQQGFNDAVRMARDYARGGQADKIPANLSEGEYVMDADVVSALGDGSTEAGAAKLDAMREQVRKHKRSAPKSKIPPKAKSPLQYMKEKKNG